MCSLSAYLTSYSCILSSSGTICGSRACELLSRETNAISFQYSFKHGAFITQKVLPMHRCIPVRVQLLSTEVAEEYNRVVYLDAQST